MSEIFVVAKLIARKESVETVKRELLNMVEPTRKEAGCIEYHLCQDNEDPAVFVFYEKWENAAALEKHKDTKHYKHYAATVLGMIEERIVNKLTKIG
jgi:quinol monooxygenase YgiN